MSELYRRIELLFGRFGLLVYQYAYFVLAFTGVILLLLFMQLPALQVDTSVEGLLHPDDPEVLEYQQFRQDFGQDQSVVIALTPTTVFDINFLGQLKSLHNSLEKEVRNLYEIKSLVNALYIASEGEEIVVRDLLESLPADARQLDEFRETVFSHSLYSGAILSENGRLTTIILKPNIPSESSDANQEKALANLGTFIDDVRSVCRKFNTPTFPILIGGYIATEVDVKRMAISDIGRFTFITYLLIMIVSAFLFRRLSGVIYPLLTVGCALGATLGVMAFLGAPITLNSTILPSFLLAVGVADSVHILTLFYRQFNLGGERKQAIVYALGHSGLAVTLTTLTTAGGLLSFTGSGIQPVAELGVYAAVGVLFALFFSLVTLPALLAITPLKQKKKRQAARMDNIDQLLATLGVFAARHSSIILGGGILLALIAVSFAVQLTFTHNSLVWLPAEMETRRAIEQIEQQLHGSLSLEILIDTGVENGIYAQPVMQDVERLAKIGEALHIDGRPVGKVIVITDTLKEINRALHHGMDTASVVPGDSRLLAQELLLYELVGGKKFREVVDLNNQKTRISIAVPYVDGMEYAKTLPLFIAALEESVMSEISIQLTGMTAIICRTFSEIIQTMGRSYLLAAVVITCLMILLLGNTKLGLLSMIPNFFPVLVGLAFMQVFGLPLDYISIMIGGIILGIAVDDTVHFMHNFRRYFVQSGDVTQAIRLTMITSGRAMLFTTLILSTSFFILLLTELKSTAHFGLITGFTIIVALVADFLLLPALLVHWSKYMKPSYSRR